MKTAAAKEVANRINFDIFIRMFSRFLASEYDPCENFLEDLKKCEDFSAVHRVLQRYSGDIIDQMGLQNECEECSDNEEARETAETNSEHYREALKRYENNSLEDEMKMDVFLQYRSRVTSFQFESIMKQNFG